MPVPTFIHAPRDGLPDLFENGDAGAPKRMFDVIDQIGWVIDENPGTHLIAHNVPLNDAPMYIRVDSDDAVLGNLLNLTSFMDSTVVAAVRVFASLADAQNETAPIGQVVAPKIGAWNTTGSSSRKINYGWVGDQRTAYLLVSGLNVGSTASPGYEIEKFAVYGFGELGRLAGDPGVSFFGGGDDDDDGKRVNFITGASGIFRRGGLTNSFGSGAGFVDGATLSSSAANELGFADGVNSSTSPFLSPVYAYESAGEMRGAFPGFVTPSMGMGTVNEGIVENVSFQTLAGPAVGLKIPISGWADRADKDAGPVFFDLSNDWDLYHAA